MDYTTYPDIETNAVEMRHITKKFGNFTANDDISFCVRAGEIHGLLGENGAGKSTLMNILYGLLQPDSGQIVINGVPRKLRGPHDAMELGIQMVHQHFMLALPYKAWENVVLGNEPRKNGIFIDKKAAFQKMIQAAERCGFKLNPNDTVRDMPIAMRQKLEIVRALYHKCDIIILDEPTAVLSENEADELLALLKRLREDGKTVILITHKLREAMNVCDRITVLRHGKLIETRKIVDTTAEGLATSMIGRPVLFDLPERAAVQGTPMLELENVSTGSSKEDIQEATLTINSGEILGIAGVEGNGQRAFVDMLLGLKSITKGKLMLNGKSMDGLKTGTRLEYIAHISEDRHAQGMISQFSAVENMLLGREKEKTFHKAGIIIDQKELQRVSSEAVKKFDVRLASLKVPAGSLSGGNQQKLLIAREFTKPGIRLVIAEHPSRGLDIASTEFVQKSLIRMRNQGISVILITADLDELLSVSDRLAVLYNGRFIAMTRPGECTPQELGLYMTGGKE